MAEHGLRSFLEPLYTMAKYCGVFPFDQDLHLSEKWWRFSLVPMVVVILTGFGIELYTWIIHNSGNSLSSVVECMHHMLSLTIVFSHCISICRFKEKLMRFGRTVAVLSEGCVYKLYIPTFYTLAGSLLLLILLTTNAIRKNEKSWLSTSVYNFLMEMTIYMISMTFCMLLEILNEHFNGLINDIYNKGLDMTTKKSLFLISCCEKLCEIYGLQLLFIFMRFLVIFVILGHSVSVDLHYYDHFPIETSLERVIYKTAMLLTVLFCLVTITGTCSKIQNSLDRFNALVFKEFRRGPNFVNDNMIKLYISKKAAVNFSACGLFSIDNSLVTSILATAITYVVIFVQFNMPDPSEVS